MTPSISSEFMALCQGQLRLLAAATGASLSTVYIAEEWLGGETTNLVPVAVYPESASNAPWSELSLLLKAGLGPSAPLWGLGSQQAATNPDCEPRSRPSLPLPSVPAAELPGRQAPLPKQRLQPVQKSIVAANQSEVLGQGAELSLDPPLGDRPGKVPLHQAVQPLFYDNRPVGILVVAREREDWQEPDYEKLEQVAQTLSAGCSMERRLQWLQGRVQQQEVAQEQQQDILDNLAHQFRNPLTALRTFGKLLLRRLSPDDHNQAIAAGIVRESDRLQALLQQINQAVDDFPLLLEGEVWDTSLEKAASSPAGAAFPKLLSAAGSPLTGRPLTLAPCAIAATIQSYWPTWEAIAQERGQELIVRLPAQLPMVHADADALGEILSNLIDNAFKYGAPQGQVVLSVEADVPPEPRSAAALEGGYDSDAPRGWQRIIVSDEGPGIPADDLARLFERHFRGVQAQGNQPGTGLGLAIVKDLVEQMEGRIEVQSPAGVLHPRPDWYRPGHSPHLGGASARPGTAVVIWLKNH